MKYITYLNELIKKKVAEEDKLVIFGQNINAGSCLGGLTRGLNVKDGNLIINTPNSENALCGIGFGLMMDGVNAIFFMKQQDFLLLGIDHLVNTYNYVRMYIPKASFTIVTPIIDCGYQGLQSSFNNFGDLCSIAGITGFTITNQVDAEKIINTQLIAPGFRIIGVSQRLYDKEIIIPNIFDIDPKNHIFKYSEGNDATIVCFNLSFPQGFGLWNNLKDKGINASLFSVNKVTPVDWGLIINHLSLTKKLIVFDDSKSMNLSCYSLIAEAIEKVQLKNKIIITRDMSEDWLSPQKDILEVDHDRIINEINQNINK